MNRRMLIIADVVMLILFIASIVPNITGVPVHEWVSLIATAVLVIHCAVHGILGRAAKGRKRVMRIVLNVTIVAVLAICAVSGIMVSGTVLPAFGMFATGYYFWDPLHALSAKLLLALLLIHVALHARWIIAMMEKNHLSKGSAYDR